MYADAVSMSHTTTAITTMIQPTPCRFACPLYWMRISPFTTAAHKADNSCHSYVDVPTVDGKGNVGQGDRRYDCEAHYLHRGRTRSLDRFDRPLVKHSTSSEYCLA